MVANARNKKVKKKLFIFLIVDSFLFFTTCNPINNTKTAMKNICTAEVSERRFDLIKGINMGNALEAPSPGEWGVNIQLDYFKVIRSAGFNTVRLPVRFSAHTSEKFPYQIDKSFLSEVDRIIYGALNENLTVILDLHHYDELMSAPDEQKERYLEIWDQLSEHYQNAPDNLFFELLNEPNQQLNSSIWNNLLEESINLIRRKNPQRTILIGGSDFNSIAGLHRLQIPAGNNLLAVFHFYEPFEFTHQGASWVLGSKQWVGNKWTGSEAEMQNISDQLERAACWSEKNKIPIIMDEFGALANIDAESRLKWTTFVVQSAEKRKIGWVYWEFCSEFGIYDCAEMKWNQEMLFSLIGKN